MRLLLVPLGSTEQHGPHLRFDTDTRIALAWAESLAQRHEGAAVVAGPLPYGSSGEHQSFAGTLSIGTDALTLVLVELARSAKASGYSRVVFVSGHAGNAQAMRTAVAQLRTEQHDVVGLVPQLTGADAHAGHTETSIMLALHPELVRMDLAAAGNTEPISSLMPAMIDGGVAAVSPNGVLGDPTGATAEAGHKYLEELVEFGLAQIAASPR